LKIDVGLLRGYRWYPHIRTCATLVARNKELRNSPKDNTMDRRATLAMTTTALLCLSVCLSASASLAQQKPLKEQLVGTWTLVSSDQVRPDGSKLQQFGANPRGINVFDPNGRFFLMVASPDLLMVASADNSKIVSNGPSKSNSEKVGGMIAESIAYYGTYTVNETEKVVILHLEASTFPNQVGTDQKRTITSLTANELKYSSPAAIPGAQVHQAWKRAE
jgi:Lipocalin-like domain